MASADITLQPWGSAWYYSLAAVFALSAMAFAYGLYSSRKELLRTLCCMSAICCYIISMQYFAMATEFGWFAIEVEFARGHQSPTQPTRQIFWIRYLSWMITTPILMAELFLLVSAPIQTILVDAFLTTIVMLTGLIGACEPRSYKWAWYFYGAIACACIALQLSTTGYRLASAKGESLRVLYVRCSLLMTVIWPGYGIVWALSEGGNVVSPDVEGVLYGILDLLGGPVFGSLVAYAARLPSGST